MDRDHDGWTSIRKLVPPWRPSFPLWPHLTLGRKRFTCEVFDFLPPKFNWSMKCVLVPHLLILGILPTMTSGGVGYYEVRDHGPMCLRQAREVAGTVVSANTAVSSGSVQLRSGRSIAVRSFLRPLEVGHSL